MWKMARLLLAGALLPGCMNGIERHCVGCQIVLSEKPVLPARAEGPVLVVLVPGAFGFNSEWDPILGALRESPALPFWVFHWPGPWRTPSLWAKALTVALQHEVDRARGPLDVLILAHSAGGLIGSYAARHLRLPHEVRLRMISIAAPEVLEIAPFHPIRSPTRPSAWPSVAKSSRSQMCPPMSRLSSTVTENRGPPADELHVCRVYVGARAGHNRVISRVGLPILDDLRRHSRKMASFPLIKRRAELQ